VPPYAPSRRIAKGSSVRTEQEKGEYLPLAILNVARSGRLQQGPGGCAESPAQIRTYGKKEGDAHDRSCSGDRRRRADWPDVGG
jgi:hypothetical protein